VILRTQDVQILFDDDLNIEPASVLGAVREVFEGLATGLVSQPPQVVTELASGGDVISYPAVLDETDVYAIKLSPYLPQPEGPPIVTAWTLVLSTETGRPQLLAESNCLTAERTAATTALAIDLLAGDAARTLAVIGLGPVGLAHLRYAPLVRRFDQVRVFSRTARAAPRAGLTLSSSAEACADGADVVLLCTSAAEPVIDAGSIAPGTLVTSVSTNAPDAHEIDPGALRAWDVYCDHLPVATSAAWDLRSLGADQVRGDLAGLLSGVAPLPRRDRPVFFRSVGLGIEDAAVALAALKEKR
jgi:L-arginine dehydrogenase